MLPQVPDTPVDAKQHSYACEASRGGPCCCTLSLANTAGGTPLYTSPEVLLAMFRCTPAYKVVTHKVCVCVCVCVFVYNRTNMSANLVGSRQ
jgi:hypothetical protein